MSDQEREIEKLENLFPSASGVAFADARKLVLQSGQSVLQSENGMLYKVSPDGRKELVRRLEPPTTVVPGSTFAIR